MSRLVLISLCLVGIASFGIGDTGALRPRTKLLYAQALRDGFWRGLAGDLAVVTYTPIRKGRFVYYYQTPHYFSKYGLSSYAHAHPHVGYAHTQYGVGHGLQQSYGVGHGLGHGLHQTYGAGHGYTAEYGVPAYSPQY